MVALLLLIGIILISYSRRRYISFSFTRFNHFLDFCMPEAIHHMVVDHTHRLHEGVTHGRAYKLETPLFQLRNHIFRFRVMKVYLSVFSSGFQWACYLRISGYKSRSFRIPFEFPVQPLHWQPLCDLKAVTHYNPVFH